MQFRVESDGTPGSIRVSGELDMLTVKGLLEGVRPHLPPGSGDLTLDIAELSFMDSTGLLAVLDLSKQLEGRGSLVLRSPAPSVAKLLQLARADTIPNLAIVSDRPTAA